MVDPNFLCQKHLCGEHLECHMFLGALKKGIGVKGYLKNNLFEPESLKIRHDILSIEMKKRGYNHKSPMRFNDFENFVNTLNEKEREVKINKRKSFFDLISRCSKCKKRARGLYYERSKTKKCFS
ncbi:MAG: pyrimidine dimer DNA glycosylase/endonuclease V [Candidatus Thorarchaeota archaeon]